MTVRNGYTRTGRWPLPGDTKPEHRSRTLANAVVREVRQADDLDKLKATVERLVDQGRGFGELWFGGVIGPAAQGPWLTAQDVAARCCVKVGTVYQWTSRKELTRYPEGYSERDVNNLLARKRGGAPTPARNNPEAPTS